jgi:hypothetical protein
MEVRAWPAQAHPEIMEYLASLSEEYDIEPPEGADSMAVGWKNRDFIREGEHTGEMWFLQNGVIYQLTLGAPDMAWLDIWMKGVLYEEGFKLPRL